MRRNRGRTSAAEAPDAIRRWLYRLTACDLSAGIDLAEWRLPDLGNVRVTADLEQSQEDLAAVPDRLEEESRQITVDGCHVCVTLDADAVCEADVVGVCAPNPLGLRGWEVIAAARQAGASRTCAALIWWK